MNDRYDDKLSTAASELSTEIPPQRDLWPGIELAITRPKRSRWTPMLARAAAVVLLVGASSMLTYVIVKEDLQPVQRVLPDLVFEQAAFGREHSLDSVYQRAGGDVALQLDHELQRLSPEARSDVEKNLAIIRRAIADINEALRDDPDSVLLQDLLVKAYREELSLMQRVGDLTKHVMLRKDI